MSAQDGNSVVEVIFGFARIRDNRTSRHAVKVTFTQEQFDLILSGLSAAPRDFDLAAYEKPGRPQPTDRQRQCMGMLLATLCKTMKQKLARDPSDYGNAPGDRVGIFAVSFESGPTAGHAFVVPIPGIETPRWKDSFLEIVEEPIYQESILTIEQRRPAHSQLQ